MWFSTEQLLVAVLFTTVCNGARNTPLIQPLTTTLPPIVPTVMVTRPSSTMLEELPTPANPPSVCPDATSSTNPLGRLRSAMRNINYTQMNSFFDAFLVFFSDEHLSEEPAKEERRLEYISGWDGVGTAAVLAEGGAAIWVPTADVVRARATVSCAWIVLDADDASQPTIAEWIARRLDRSGRVGADARLTSVGEWQILSAAMQHEGLQLSHAPALIDQLWAEEVDSDKRRPEFSRIVANLHMPEYTGLTWREKINLVRRELQESGADAMVVTALDEVAWLLNVRGKDVPYAPLLKAFVIVSSRDVRVFAPPGKLSMPVREALAVYNCHPNNNNNCTRVNDYTSIYAELRRATESKILIPTAGTFQRGASAAIAQAVPQNKRMFQLSPIIYLKAQKNEAEIKGMRRAHLRDAVAMCTLFSYMETKVRKGLTELSVASTVDATRATQANYLDPSMKTRVAFGPSATEPEYIATNRTNRRVYFNSTLVIQSGGQYLEGTTIVTRTIHYGQPTRDMKVAYTSVLRSLAAIGTLQIPNTLPAAHIDPVTRAPLWTAKQDYPHPTGHGVGAALYTKEDPVVIDYRQDTNLYQFKEGYFITSEPAWYDRKRYGVRLGNVLEVVGAVGAGKGDGYLGFQEVTLLPFEPKLIDKNLLTEYEINWLNAYNERIRKIVGPELRDQGLMDIYYWMTNKTVHIDPPSKRRVSSAGAATRSYHGHGLLGVLFGLVFVCMTSMAMKIFILL